MSYDLWWEIAAGGPEPMVPDWDRSPTYNLAPMFAAAGLCLRALDGEPGERVAATVGEVLSDLQAEPDEWRRYNPPNGWGDYEAAVEFVADLLIAARRWPLATLRVS